MAYIKPGVYAQYKKSTGDVLLTAGLRVPAFIGTGLTYFTAQDEGIIRGQTGYPYSSTNMDVLAHVATSIIAVGDFPGDNSYVVTTDYVLSNGVIEWVGTHKPTDGEVFYITYQYDKDVAVDYEPQLFSTIDEVFTEYGISDGTYSLPLAAEIAFQNGAPFVICTQVLSDIDAQYIAAIDKLQQSVSNVEAKIIVPLSTSTTVQNYLKAHVYSMSSKLNGKPRMAIMGMAVGSTQSDITARAIALGTPTTQDDGGRVVLAYDEMTRDLVQSDGSAVEHTLDSTYLACAVAGAMGLYTVQTPLTRKPIQGFKTAAKARAWLDKTKDIYATAGVLILNDKGGNITIRHQLTTDTSAYNFTEISITQSRDNVTEDVISGCDPFIGTYETPTTNANIYETVNAVLTAKLNDGVIVNYGGISVTTDGTNPSNRNVLYWIDVADPINRIYLTYTIKQTI